MAVPRAGDGASGAERNTRMNADDAGLGALLLAAPEGDARNRARPAALRGCRKRTTAVRRASGSGAQRTATRGGRCPFSRAVPLVSASACEALPRAPCSDGAPGDPGLLRA